MKSVYSAVRSSALFVAAIVVVMATLESGALAAEAPAPAPSLLVPGHAAAVLPSVVGPVLVAALSFLAFRSL